MGSLGKSALIVIYLCRDRWMMLSTINKGKPLLKRTCLILFISLLNLIQLDEYLIALNTKVLQLIFCMCQKKCIIVLYSIMLQMLVHVDYTPNAWFACYRWEYIVLVLFVQLHVMGLVQIFLILIVTVEYHIITFLIRGSVFHIWIFSAELISVCVSLHECGSWWVWLENLHFSNCLLAISAQIFDWYSVLETCIGLEFLTGNLDWKLWSSNGNHISVEMVMFLQLQNFY